MQILSSSKTLKLDDRAAMTLLSPIHVDKYFDVGGYRNMFMTMFLFPISPHLKRQLRLHFLRPFCTHTCILVNAVLTITIVATMNVKAVHCVDDCESEGPHYHFDK